MTNIKLQKNQTLKNAFTLLELLLVIAVIAILAGVVLFNLNPAQRLDDANSTKTAAKSNDIEKAINNYTLENGGLLPSNLRNLTLARTYDICKSSQTGDCINLDELVSSGFLSEIPTDSTSSTSVISGYKLFINPEKKVVKTYSTDEYNTEYSSKPTLSSGLLAYWKFDETTADTCTGGVNDICDSTSNGYNGASLNFSSILGKYGSAGDLDGGSTKYTDFGDPAAFDFGNGNFTISLWAYRLSGFGLWDGSVIGKWNTGGAPGSNEWGISHGGTIDGTQTYPSFGIESGSTYYAATSPETTLNNTWYHLTAMRDGNHIRLFVNGVQKAVTSVGSISINNISGRTLKIGKIDGGAYGLYGYVDEVRVYSRALSAEEVGKLYNLAPAPLAYWKFDDASGTLAQDSSGNGNNGTLTNGPVWTGGKYGNAISFDGVNDYVASSSITLANNFSTSFWLKTNGTASRWRTLVRYTDNYNSFYIQNSTQHLYLEGAASKIFSNTIVTDDNWHHITITRDNNIIRVYVDGIKDSNETNKSNSINFLGIGYSGYPNEYYNGLIDDVRIYNYALTQTQVLQVMNNEI